MKNNSSKDIVYIKSMTSTSMSKWGDSTILKDCKSNIIKNRNIIINSDMVNHEGN